MTRAVLRLAILLLAVVSLTDDPAAQFDPPFFVNTDLPGRPALAVGEAPALLGDDLDLEPALVVPQLGGSMFTSFTVIIGSSGAPILVLLEPPIDFGGGAQAATGDLGGGGVHDDVIVAGNESSALALTFDAPGPTFAPNPAIPFDPGGVITTPHLIDVGDVTNDGAADAVVIQGGAVSDELFVFAGDGAGGFLPAPVQVIPLLPLGNKLPSTDSILADVDADGFLDCVVTFGESSETGGIDGFVAFYRNDGQPGGQFITPEIVVDSSGDPVVTVLAGNFEAATPELELLITSHLTPVQPGFHRAETLMFRYVPGAGVFQRVVQWPGFAESSQIGIVAKFGAVGDIDSDGDDDALFTSNDHIMIPDNSEIVPPIFYWSLLNNGDSTFTVIKDTTRFAGRAVDPILDDFGAFISSFTAEEAEAEPVPASDKPPELVLIFGCDTSAGTTLASVESTHAAALTGSGDGTFLDEMLPPRYLVGEAPADGFIVELDTLFSPGGRSGGPDIVVPNTDGRSYSVLKGDGAGGVLSNTEVAVALPGGTTGGPTDAQTAQLDASFAPDMVIYSPIEFGGASEPFLHVYHGDGTGGFTLAQTFVVNAAGEMALGDVSGDGIVDVVVTLRTNGLDDVSVFVGEETSFGSGVPTGTFDTFAAATATAPAGFALTGGLALDDVDGDGALDIVTSCSDDGTTLSVLVFDNEWSTLSTVTPQTPIATGTSLSTVDVESIVMADFDGDTNVDVMLGVRTGELVALSGDGTGGFTAVPQAPAVAATGGGSLAVGEVFADGDYDLVSAKGEPADQQVVQVHRGFGNAAFSEVELCGWNASDNDGGARPLLGDLDGDSVVDLVLVHGPDDSVTILLNDRNDTQPIPVGYPGTGGITPSLKVSGYTAVGQKITLTAEGMVGKSIGLFALGFGPEAPPLAMSQFFSALFVTFDTGGSASIPGSGGGSTTLAIPKTAALVGFELRLQAAAVDAAGLAGLGLSLSNGVAVKLLSE